MLPLHERPIKETTTHDALLDWFKTAVAQAQAVGSSYADADGGPSAEDLLVRHHLVGTEMHQPAQIQHMQMFDFMTICNQGQLTFIFMYMCVCIYTSCRYCGTLLQGLMELLCVQTPVKCAEALYYMALTSAAMCVEKLLMPEPAWTLLSLFHADRAELAAG